MSYRKVMIISIILLLLCFILSMAVGRYPLKINAIFKLVKYKVLNLQVEPDMAQDYIVFWTVRLPRAIMGLFVGAALSISGTVFQGLFRNPLVSPDILGISAGASFGAGIAIILTGTSTIAIQSCSFIFGLLAVVIAFRIGGGGRQRGNITALVLAGVIVSAVFSAGLGFLKYVADPYEQLPAIVFWTMGGFGKIVWRNVIKTVPVMFCCSVILHLLRWKLNIMTLGDDEARSLGVNVNRIRAIYIFLSTLMVASSISSCGTIGWVGLVVPHIARLIVGPDHYVLLPFSAILGGGFMLIMDTIARSIISGEIPISIITSLLGAPFLGYLLIKQERNTVGL